MVATVGGLHYHIDQIKVQEADTVIAVLTGDLVHSTKMAPAMYKATLACLQQQLAVAQKQCHAVAEIYRGDGFQVQYPNPVLALASALAIKLALHAAEFATKPVQCTLSLAYGSGQTNDGALNTAMGQVFIASGRGLEATPRGDLTLHFEQSSKDDALVLLTRFFNHQLNTLTKSQAQLLGQYIASDFAEHKEIARLTGTSRQNISNRLAGIGAFLIRDYMALVNHKVAAQSGEE